MSGHVIDKPGLYPDIPEDAYHADCVPEGSLSRSGAKLMLPPSCPAIFDHQRRHPKPPTKAMDLGTVVHKLLLGKGQDITVINADSYRKQAVQQLRDEAIAAGRIPMLTREWERALQIEAAVRDDDDAGQLFDAGQAEVSAFWKCPEFGIWKRCRFDWLPSGYGRPIIADVKTCASASPAAIAKAVWNFGYYMQDPWYREGYQQVTGDWPEFYFVFVQTEEPYLVVVADLNPDAVALGEARCRLAAERYRDCTASGIWPGYTTDILHVSLPAYAGRQIESEISNDEY